MWDLETTGLSAERNAICEIAAKAYNPRTLEPYPDGGEFHSLLAPEKDHEIDEGALRVNGLTRQELADAPPAKIVWRDFIRWVGQWNTKGTKYTAPIGCGKNIRLFDIPFVEAYNKRFSPKKEKQVLFSTKYMLDLDEIMWLWFEGSDDPNLPNYKMDTLRPFFGISSEGAHRALKDVEDTAVLIMNFLRLSREIQKRRSGDGTPFVKFKSFGRPMAA